MPCAAHMPCQHAGHAHNTHEQNDSARELAQPVGSARLQAGYVSWVRLVLRVRATGLRPREAGAAAWKNLSQRGWRSPSAWRRRARRLHVTKNRLVWMSSSFSQSKSVRQVAVQDQSSSSRSSYRNGMALKTCGAIPQYEAVYT